MKKLVKFFAILTFVVITACSPEQMQSSSGTAPRVSTSPGDLAGLIDAGTLSIVMAHGNGSSSGASVEGVIRNNLSSSVSVNIVMSRPVFFRNNGRGQNMIGSMLFNSDGGYSEHRGNSFISLPPNEEVNVLFIAYCADFEKDNPTYSERFAIEDAPPQLIHVMSRIAAYARTNPTVDITTPAQVAVWLAQGISAPEIAERFQFSASDEMLARQLLQ